MPVGRHDDRRRAQQALAQLVAFAKLLKHRSLGHGGALLLGNRLMHVRIEGLAASLHFLDARLGEHTPELRLNHCNPRLEGLCAAFGVGLNGAQSHLKVVQHRNQFLDQTFVGKPCGVLPLTGGALFEIVKVRRGSQQPFPRLVAFGRAGFQVFDLLGRQRRGLHRHHGFAGCSFIGHGIGSGGVNFSLFHEQHGFEREENSRSPAGGQLCYAHLPQRLRIGYLAPTSF